MQGKVSKVRKDRKGLCIDDVWYSGYKPSYIGEAQVGDEVSFTFTEKGDWKNITEDTLKVLSSAPKSSGGGGGGSSNSGGGNQFRSVPQLVRGDALGNAVKSLEGLSFPTAKAAVKATLYVAGLYEAYLNGEIAPDLTKDPTVGAAQAAPATSQQVKHEAQQEAPAQQEPEQEPDSPAPSLDKFLGDD